LTPFASSESSGLASLDAASFHKTPSVLEALRNTNIMSSLIPGGCKSLIQVFDVSVNGPFKNFLKNAREDGLCRIVQLKGEGILAELDKHYDEGGVEGAHRSMELYLQ
jgi:hypothetical protein